jgi:hypothetical protein
MMVLLSCDMLCCDMLCCDMLWCFADTGVQFNHPDLAAHMWGNPGEIPGNGIDDDKNGYVDDVCECLSLLSTLV